MLGAGLVELRVVLKFEQKFEGAAYSELFVQASPRRGFHTLHGARVAAATVGPVKGPKALAGRTLLHEQFAVRIENQQRECAVQNAATLVARFLAQLAESTVGLVDQDQGIRICHNVRIIETIHVPKFIHNNNPTGLLAPATSPDDSCLRNFRASAGVR
jgi:hypothetical protein